MNVKTEKAAITKKTKNLISDEEFARQMAAAEITSAKPRSDPRAVRVTRAGQRITLEMESGWSVSFDPRVLPELVSASIEEARDVQILGAGYTVEWTTLDVHLGTGTIIAALLGDAFLRSRSASLNGKVKSVRASAASAANGRLGGRPRNTDQGAANEKREVGKAGRKKIPESK